MGNSWIKDLSHPPMLIHRSPGNTQKNVMARPLSINPTELTWAVFMFSRTSNFILHLWQKYQGHLCWELCFSLKWNVIHLNEFCILLCSNSVRMNCKSRIWHLLKIVCLPVLPFYVCYKALCVVLGVFILSCFFICEGWFQLQCSYRRAGSVQQAIPPEAVNSLLLWNKLSST